MTGVLHYGLYQGICQNDVDPEKLNRIQATCPTVFGNHSTMADWAWPCTPPGVPVTLPAPGSAVWIGFIGGDTDYPYWAGTWQVSTTSTTTVEGQAAPVPVSTGILSAGSYVIVDPNGTGEPGIGFKFSPNATSEAFAYPAYDRDGIFIGGVGSTGGYKVQGDLIQVTPNIFTGPWFGLDGLTNPPTMLFPSPVYGEGLRLWAWPGTPAQGWVSGVTRVGDLWYNQSTFSFLTCIVSGLGENQGIWINGIGVNQIGTQVAYDPITTAFSTTCAVENTWYPADLTSGSSPSITLPDDGRLYKVEWTAPYWTCSTNDLLCTAALGISTTSIITLSSDLVNQFAQAFVPVVIPRIIGEGQTITCFTNCSNGTPTITFGASVFGPSALSAYCVG